MRTVTAVGAIMPTVSVSIPKTLLHYTILQPLGSGGMGEVYLAEDTKLGRQIALKVLRRGREDDVECQRFEREARPWPH